MQSRFLNKILFSIGLISMVWLLLPFSLPKAHAIGIRPIRYEVTVAPGESIQGSVTVVNETDTDFTAEPSLSAFARNTEQGAPIYTSNPDDLVQDAASWIDISLDNILVPAGEMVEVPYAVNVPLDAEAGGKYVLIGYQPVKEKNSPVMVNVRAASTLILTVEGDVTPQGEVEFFGLQEPLMADQPFLFEVTFKNTGNIHVKPTGWIEVIDQKTGQKLRGIGGFKDPQTGVVVNSDKIPINLQKGNVLPDSIRTFSGEWINNLENGTYKGVLNLEYAPEATPITQEFEFEINDHLSVDRFELIDQGQTSDFELSIKNDGLAEQKVNGYIEITNTFGYKVAEIPFPEDLQYIAPNESKTITLPWLNKDVPPDRYTATLRATYGFSDQSLEAQITFGELNRTTLYLTIALGAVILIAVIVIVMVAKRRKAKRNE